jgi:hypothetical protein
MAGCQDLLMGESRQEFRVGTLLSSFNERFSRAFF